MRTLPLRSRQTPSEAPQLGRAWWTTEALDHLAEDPIATVFTGDDRADVVIVGGGYSGLWTAIGLKQRDPGLDVVVLEAGAVGFGPSGINGGFMSGYWHSLPTLTKNLGREGAMATAEAGATAQKELIRFIKAGDDDVWLNTEDTLAVATSSEQQRTLEARARAFEAAGIGDRFEVLDQAALRERCAGSAFRFGLAFDENATVHPGRLARMIRRAALKAGVRLFEGSRMTAVDGAGPHTVRTALGAIECDKVVVATNHEQTTSREGRRHLTTMTSYSLATAPIPDRLAELGWRPGLGLYDARMFLNWFRSTADGRIVFGTSSGPIARSGDAAGAVGDQRTVERALAGFRQVFPELAGTPMAAAWAGPIDVSSDRLPYCGRRPGTSVFYGFGLSGHGVNASWIVGQCLASLALGNEDEWTSLPLCTRSLQNLPGEPVRWLAGNAIKESVLRVDDALDQGAKPPAWARFVSNLPRMLRMRIGVRD